MIKEYKVAPVALIGDSVLVMNYRKANMQWEQGVITAIEGKMSQNNEVFTVHYTVILDRHSYQKSKLYPDGGRRIVLTVSEEYIQPLH